MFDNFSVNNQSQEIKIANTCFANHSHNCNKMKRERAYNELRLPLTISNVGEIDSD